jgi:hypothetical protein
MAKRAKVVFSTDMVAHIWAQQKQGYGRNHGNFYFEGATIYSYGSHFPIAKFVERKGKRAVLFTTRTYGSTTSKHLRMVLNALDGLGVLILHVYRPDNDPRSSEVKKDAEAEMKTAVDKVARARSHLEYAIEACHGIALRANDLSKFYGWRWRLKVPPFDEAKLAKQRVSNAAAGERNRVKREEERARWEAANAEQMVKNAVKREAWLRGEAVQYPWSGYDEGTLLRVHGDLVQTSRGAEVPVEHAKRLWPIIERVMQRGEAYQRNGHSEHIGDFVVDRIEPTGDIKIGCHLIKFDQVQKIARELQLIN